MKEEQECWYCEEIFESDWRDTYTSCDVTEGRYIEFTTIQYPFVGLRIGSKEDNMCDYCEKEKTILKQISVSLSELSWCFSSLKHSEDLYDFEYTLELFIDRGYLRLVDLEECQCLDHGDKIKINFCPFCGREL